MKKNIIKSGLSALSILFCVSSALMSKAQDSLESPLIITLSHYSVNNQVQYLIVNTKSKRSGKFQPVPGVEVNLYLNKDSTGKDPSYIGKVTTDEKGKGSTNIPPSLAGTWKYSEHHTFVAVTGKNKEYDAANTEINIAEARLTIDTTADKNVIVTFRELKDQKWIAVKGVEIKIGIRRLGGDLLINDDPVYTTDSHGQVKGEFKRIGIPGDKTGNIVLVAKIEDNDSYGNMRMERSEPWGTKLIPDADFFHRALWASRFHSPVWLVVIAYSIIIAVWGTLIYLVFLLIKIRKLGKETKN